MDELRNILALIGEILHQIWNYDLVSVSQHQIRISNLTLALLLVIIGVKYFKHFSIFIRNSIRSKVTADKDAVNALEKLILYIAICLYIITILQIANIPLNIFAFIGGALALGIGLGAQILISNFISSLVIMLERPIKIGDIVEIEGIMGTVTSVGARSVIITTLSNVEVLVPNSKLMQNILVNWTLSDNKIKCQAEITISKQSEQQFNLKNLIEIFEAAFKKLEINTELSNPELALTRIEPSALIFLMNFYYDIKEIKNPQRIQHKINIELFDRLAAYQFSIKYLKIIEIKPTTEK